MSESEEETEYEYDSCSELDNYTYDEDSMNTTKESITSTIKEIGLGYRILSYEEVTPILNNLVTEVSGLLDIRDAASEVLLRCFKWNKEILFNEYCSTEADSFWSKAGINCFANDIPASSSSMTESSPRKRRREVFNCAVCCDPDCFISDSYALDCGHRFCKECFEGYLNSGIGDGPDCCRLTCPQYKCQQAISSSDVKTLCSPDVHGIYTMYLTRNFIENSTTMRWCPSPGCTKVALKEDNADNDITITCTECCSQFCFRCGKPDHTMLSCELLEAWQLQCNSDMENYSWIVSNTKKCPKCKNRIEKNGGCMHMSCKLCRHGFCWHCLEPWAAEGHTWNHANCSLHIPEDTNHSEKDDKSPAEMERFIRYFSRYDGHDKSMKIADTQRELVLERMAMLMSQAGSSGVYTDVEFLIQAVEQIISGREALKNAYAFLYFLLDESPEKELLENSLELMEHHIESLSHLIETSRQSPIVSDKKTPSDEQSAEQSSSSEVLDRDQCLNLTSAIKKSLATMLNTRAEQSFLFR